MYANDDRSGCRHMIGAQPGVTARGPCWYAALKLASSEPPAAAAGGVASVPKMPARVSPVAGFLSTLADLAYSFSWAANAVQLLIRERVRIAFKGNLHSILV